MERSRWTREDFNMHATTTVLFAFVIGLLVFDRFDLALIATTIQVMWIKIVEVA